MKQKQLNVGFITTVSGRWPREVPNQRDESYSAWLREKFPQINLVKHKTIAVNNQEVEKITEEFKKASVDLVILVIGAFTGDYSSTYLAEELKVPVIVWAPYEPSFDGGRLMSNALVAATMNAAALHRIEAKYHFVYGDYTDARVVKEISLYIKVYAAIKKLRSTFMGLIGYRPTGFYSSSFDEALIRQIFGIKMEEFDLSVVFQKADAIDLERVKEDVAQIKKKVAIIRDVPEEYLENHSRLKIALEEFIDEQGFNAISLKCWPEMGQMKYTPCAVLSRFADKGFVIGCESDVDATITMLVQKYLTDRTTWMCDLIQIDEEENTALFWHCGQAGLSLKDPDSEVEMTDHPLAGQGTALQTTLRPGKVTIARISKIGDHYKMFIVRGEAVPTKKVVTGVMVNVKLEEPVRQTVYQIAKEGVAHHYSIVWEDVVEEMKMICKILGVEIIPL